MRFCEVCSQMLYVKMSENGKDLTYYCKNCETAYKESKDNESIVVIDYKKIDDSTKYMQFLNKNIKFDPSLPRVNNIVCTNKDCKSHTGGNNEVIYIKYDHVNMKYMYYCCVCEGFWKPT